MPVYALLSDGKVDHTFVADSVEALGEQALGYEIIDVTTMYPRPGVGATFDGTTWKAFRQTGETTSFAEVSFTADKIVTPELEDSGKSKK